MVKRRSTSWSISLAAKYSAGILLLHSPSYSFQSIVLVEGYSTPRGRSVSIPNSGVEKRGVSRSFQLPWKRKPVKALSKASSTTMLQNEIRINEAPSQEKIPVKSAIFNLIKAIIGSGVLALPSGVAAMSDHKLALVPAVALICMLGALSAYTFALYGRLIHASQAMSLGEVWEKIKGKSSAWIISVASLAFCLGGALAYSILLGDAFPALAEASGLTGLGTSRPLWIIFLTVTVLYPLCSLSSLAALAPISVVGVIGVLATTCFMGWRCPSLNVASPYNTAAVGAIARQGLTSTLLPNQLPSFGTFSKSLASPASLILTGMAATAFLGHFSAAEFYHAMKTKTTTTTTTTTGTAADKDCSTRSLQDYFKMTMGGFGSVTLINCLVMAFGFLTFGGNSKGMILNNFSTMDPGASICRLLMAICVIGGYPFVISASRSEAKELIHLLKPSLLKMTTTTDPHETEKKLERTITRVLLTGLAGTALVMKNAGFVIGLNGALMGSAMIYIFPCMLFLEHTSSSSSSSSVIQQPRKLKLERLFCRFLIGFGVFAAVAGGAGCILNTYFPHML